MDCYLYTTERFLALAREQLSVEVGDATLIEARDVRARSDVAEVFRGGVWEGSLVPSGAAIESIAHAAIERGDLLRLLTTTPLGRALTYKARLRLMAAIARQEKLAEDERPNFGPVYWVLSLGSTTRLRSFLRWVDATTAARFAADGIERRIEIPIHGQADEHATVFVRDDAAEVLMLTDQPGVADALNSIVAEVNIPPGSTVYVSSAGRSAGRAAPHPTASEDNASRISPAESE